MIMPKSTNNAKYNIEFAGFLGRTDSANVYFRERSDVLSKLQRGASEFCPISTFKGLFGETKATVAVVESISGYGAKYFYAVPTDVFEMHFVAVGYNAKDINGIYKDGLFKNASFTTFSGFSEKINTIDAAVNRLFESAESEDTNSGIRYFLSKNIRYVGIMSEQAKAYALDDVLKIPSLQPEAYLISRSNFEKEASIMVNMIGNAIKSLKRD